MFLPVLALLIAAASAAVVVRGQEYSANEGSAVVEGRTRVVRRLAEHQVSTMTELWDKLSSAGLGSDTTKRGTKLVANGDTTTLAVGEYKCSDGQCASEGEEGFQVYADELNGAVQCSKDDASCVLNGESSKGGFLTNGTGGGKLIVRAIKFFNSKSAIQGGGLALHGACTVDIILCVFDSCTSNGVGAGVYAEQGTVNIYGAIFTGNNVKYGKPDGNGGYNKVGLDVAEKDDGTITIHDTCPTPHSATTPTKGKF